MTRPINPRVRFTPTAPAVRRESPTVNVKTATIPIHGFFFSSTAFVPLFLCCSIHAWTQGQRISTRLYFFSSLVSLRGGSTVLLSCVVYGDIWLIIDFSCLQLQYQLRKLSIILGIHCSHSSSSPVNTAKISSNNPQKNKQSEFQFQRKSQIFFLY